VTADTDWHRVHPSSLVFRLAAHVRSLLIPGLVFLWFASGDKWAAVGLVLFVPSILIEVIRYISLRYRFDVDEMVIRQGLVFRNERHIPFQRIQNIDLVQNVFHRVLDVAEVRLETAGGVEPEAVLRVLSTSAVDFMRTRVFTDRADTLAAEATSAGDAGGAEALGRDVRSDGSRILIRVPTSELARLGLIFNRGLVAVSIALGLAYEFDLFESFNPFEKTAAFVEPHSPPWIAWFVAGLVIAVLALLYGLSIAWTIMRLFAFTLERKGDDIRLSCGLLTKRSATIPRHRIQFVSVHQSLMHRVFGRATIRVETAGAVIDEDGDAFSRKWFVPILPLARVADLLRELDLGIELDRLVWRPLAPKAKQRMVRKGVLVALVACAGLALLIHPWAALVGVVAVPFAVWHACAKARFTGYAPFETGLAFRSGAWNHRTSATLFDKLQVAAVYESPFDRRYHMARFALDTAGAGPADHKIRVPYLERSVAEELARGSVRHAQEPRVRG
jgi:putative membrane protein